MKNKKVLAFFFFFSIPLIFLPSTYAAWVWSPEAGKFVNPEGAVQDTAEEQYDYAMRLYKENDLDEAAKQFKNLVKKFPNARLAAESQYRLGTIYEEKGDYVKAFKAYKTLVESYPQSERLNEVVEREFRIGNVFLSGKKGKLMGVEILPSLPRAAEIFEHIVKQAPYSEWGDQAQFRLGLTYKKWGHYEEAVGAFQTFIDQYPQSELLPDAQFQLAETTFLRSAAASRDQRVLDEASDQVSQFLERYPDSTASEKVAKLRQEIDEKNAEKNYRIGLYYERENYLTSAFIYYSDVAETYAHTKWGEKAAEKLNQLKRPVDYLSSQEKEIQQEMDVLQAKLTGLKDEESLERGRVKRQMERLEKRQKSIEKSKGESLERREQDIRRRERELKDKFKALESKKKLQAKNPSEDFKRAIDRWTASLESERSQLDREKQQLQVWRETLGVKSSRVPLEFLPFVGEPVSELDKVRRFDAKRLYKVSNEKKILLGEKEVLYKQYNELSALLADLEAKQLEMDEDGRNLETAQHIGNEELEIQRMRLAGLRSGVDEIRKTLDKKRKIYEENYGPAHWLSWMNVPKQVVTTSAGAVRKSVNQSLTWANPFDGGEPGLAEKSPEELAELEMHLKEKIVAQRNVTETLSRAFDDELALQEQNRMAAALESEEPVDLNELRRSIKMLEKDIRARFEDIDDRHKRKKELLKNLDQLMKQNMAEETILVKAGRAAASPGVVFVKFWRAFIFGLPDKDVTLTHSAELLDADSKIAGQAKELKDEIEVESLMIEAQNRQILRLQKELEILKARASLSGGYKFRSAFVRVPYAIIGEAIDSARRVIPAKDRHEKLIGRLDEETQSLEKLRTRLKEVQSAIASKEMPSPPTVAEETTDQEPVRAAAESEGVPQKAAGEKELETEIQTLARALKIQQDLYRREKAAYEAQLRALGLETKESKKGFEDHYEKYSKQQRELQDEMREITEDLRKTILKEQELERAENDILAKRIDRIDRFLLKVTSKAVSQDLLTERQRLEERVAQIELRNDFLTKELERFQLADNARR
ncbi:MAG: outer membrane protein assembly factor BamD [Candidatus Omnitrophica bacterium]|nr:outer membrane protein assembly factor BamD [Candidatus Omnitrophota bacterium]